MCASELLGKPNKINCEGVTCDGLASRPGGVEILLAASCYRNRDKLWHLKASGFQGFTFFSDTDSKM